MQTLIKYISFSFILFILLPLAHLANATTFEVPGFRAPDCKIPAEQPHPSKFVDVLGHSMHYIEAGDPQGDVFLLIHGNPTYSYIWRNVMNHIVGHVPNARVIAIDAIGMGYSERPDDLYFTFEDHVSHLQGFVAALDLKDITLVSHDWGSGWALTFADREPEKVRATAFFEALLPPEMPFTYENMNPFSRDFIGALRTPGVGEELVINQHVFLDAGFEGAVLCSALNGGLDPAIYDAYRAPWLEPASRRVLLQMPRSLPVDGFPENVTTAVESHIEWLTTTEIPKLLMHVQPGAVIQPASVEWLENNLSNLSSVSIGPGIHFIQESNPAAVGRTISKWYLDKVNRACSGKDADTFGTSGNDSVVTQGRFFLGGDGDDHLSAAACNTRFVFGGQGADTLTAGDDSFLLGGHGNDFLDATFSKASILKGGAGQDTFWSGDKTLAIGDKGDDTFLFFGGKSRAYGGKGQDKFYLAVDGNLPGANDHNTIMDFESGKDKVVFNGFGSNLTGISDLTLAVTTYGLRVSVGDTLIAKMKGIYQLLPEDLIFE